MALYRDERKRLDALFDAVRRKAAPMGRLDAEQREWLVAWREGQQPFDYAANSTDEIGAGLRSDIKRILYGDVPQILITDTDATAGDKWQRYLERQ